MNEVSSRHGPLSWSASDLTRSRLELRKRRSSLTSAPVSGARGRGVEAHVVDHRAVQGGDGDDWDKPVKRISHARCRRWQHVGQHVGPLSETVPFRILRRSSSQALLLSAG